MPTSSISTNNRSLILRPQQPILIRASSDDPAVGVRWVELSSRHASAPLPVVQRQEGHEENAVGPVGIVGLVDRPCINVQPIFRPLHVAYSVVEVPLFRYSTHQRKRLPLPIHTPSLCHRHHGPKPTRHSVNPAAHFPPLHIRMALSELPLYL